MSHLGLWAGSWLRAQVQGIAVEKLSVIGMCLFMMVKVLIALDFGAGAGYWSAALWILFATFGTAGSLIYAGLLWLIVMPLFQRRGQAA